MTKRSVAKKTTQLARPLKNMGVSERMRKAEELGNQVNAVLKKAHVDANTILAPYGWKLANFKVDFCEVEDQVKDSEDNKLGQDLNQKVSPA